MAATDSRGVARVRAALADAGAASEVVVLADTSRTAADAAAALGVEVGQIASSLVFVLPDGSPLLVITSGRHRVDVGRVAAVLGVDGLGRADADFVKRASGFSIGGVAPVGWSGDADPVVVIDEALGDYGEVWAAGGHPHAVFATSYDELVRLTGARPVRVADD
ncbi:MAG TPA: YbaK/EbsC family protein [Acidimicrobiales bacterium]|nr:YbaK/EbsC family protein [Acidimicrobiales bacterium]